MLRRAVPFECPGVFSTSRNYSPNQHPLKSSLGWHVSSLVGPWEAEGRPCQKRVFLTKMAQLTKIQICLFLQSLGTRLTKMTKSTKTPWDWRGVELHHTDANWSSRHRVWQRFEMPQPTVSFPILLPQVLRGEGGHSDDLRKRHLVRAKKLLVEHKFTKAWFNKNLV